MQARRQAARALRADLRPGRELKPGRHKLLVTAFDDLGNPGPPEAFRFKVLKPPLKAGRAEGTVATALRRHKFANRVVANLEQSCSRVGRFKFSCRFSSGFPGYSLNGRGPVELQNGRVSYRFRVRAQGRTLDPHRRERRKVPGLAQQGKPAGSTQGSAGSGGAGGATGAGGAAGGGGATGSGAGVVTGSGVAAAAAAARL